MNQNDQKPEVDESIPGNEVITISPEAFDRFEQQLIEMPSVADNEKLQELLKRPRPWV